MCTVFPSARKIKTWNQIFEGPGGYRGPYSSKNSRMMYNRVDVKLFLFRYFSESELS